MISFLKNNKWVVGFALSYLLIRLLSKLTYGIDTLYFSGFYTPFSIFLRRVFGTIPFSVGDCLYAILLVYFTLQAYKLQKNWKEGKKHVINNIFKALTIFYVAFTVFWGFNYYRTPLHESLHVKNTYTKEELIVVTHQLINQLNTIHVANTGNKNDLVTVPQNSQLIYQQAADGYKNLSLNHIPFKYVASSIKPSLFSVGLSYMGFSGYINPFTNEAQVNHLIPKTSAFVTASHEIAHQIGIGPEAEANFIGYVAARNNKNLYFDYAAVSFALRYCLSSYPFLNETEYKNCLETINPGIRKDWQANQDFWQSHQTFIDVIFKFIYDKFLKVNQQQHGIEGYSRFLDLLIQFELNKKGCV